jgi:hypothetical protein
MVLVRTRTIVRVVLVRKGMSLRRFSEVWRFFAGAHLVLDAYFIGTMAR